MSGTGYCDCSEQRAKVAELEARLKEAEGKLNEPRLGAQVGKDGFTKYEKELEARYTELLGVTNDLAISLRNVISVADRDTKEFNEAKDSLTAYQAHMKEGK